MAWKQKYNSSDVSSQTLAVTVAASTEGLYLIRFANRSTSATATATVWRVPTGETVGNQHLVEPSTTLAVSGQPGAVLTVRVPCETATKIYVQSSTANVTCTIDADESAP